MRSDESIDELAGEALLKDVPQHITRADSLHTELTANALHRPTSNQSTKLKRGDLDKPLPPIPNRKSTAERYGRDRPALAPKTTNLKIRRDHQSQIIKSKISPPILRSTTSNTIKLGPRPSPGSPSTTLPKLELTSTDPLDLDQKIKYLMQQAVAQEAESERKEAILAIELAKPSPRQRAKQVFVKASHALRDRLGTGNSAERSRGDRLPSPSLASSTHLSNQVQNSPVKVRNRVPSPRMDEGVNLSNPKIQSSMGEGNVPRKPLPVYESMRSRIKRSDSLEDPFHEIKHPSGSRSTKEVSGLPFDFEARKNTSKGSRANGQSDSVSGVPEASLLEREGRSSFTHFVSGLAQHSETMTFSSSPEATSTPQQRLDPNPTTTRMKTRNNPVKSPSILEVSFERPSDESKTATDGSQSIKRKSAQENLRSPAEPEPKKMKKSKKLPSDEAVDLAINLANLDTEDEWTPLSPEKYAKKRRPPRQLNRKKGLGIFDLGKSKGKEPESRREEHLTGKQRPHISVSKRSSFSRPSSMLFGRAGGKKFAKLDDDEMDVDELGSEDPKYHTTKGRR